MGTATAPVRGSGGCPAWIARVEKPRSRGVPFTVPPVPPGDSSCASRCGADDLTSAVCGRPAGRGVRSKAMSDAPLFSPLRWQDGSLLLLDQTRLPDEEVWLDCRPLAQV